MSMWMCVPRQSSVFLSRRAGDFGDTEMRLSRDKMQCALSLAGLTQPDDSGRAGWAVLCMYRLGGLEVCDVAGLARARGRSVAG